MPNPEKMFAGERHNELVAIEFTEMHPRYGRIWRFRCDCGQEAEMIATNVRSGRAKTCGHARLGAIGTRRPYPTLEAALLAGLPDRVPGACWEWRGMPGPAGYGSLFYRAKRPLMAHRAAWEVFQGQIPEGMQVLHRCDNPPCCNPDHLFLGGDRENSDDKVAKRRHNFGEKVPQAKLTVDQAREIRAITNATQAEIANRYGVSVTTVGNIRRGTSWLLALE